MAAIVSLWGGFILKPSVEVDIPICCISSGPAMAVTPQLPCSFTIPAGGFFLAEYAASGVLITQGKFRIRGKYYDGRRLIRP
jgi:hypothetical protein